MPAGADGPSPLWPAQKVSIAHVASFDVERRVRQAEDEG